MKRVFGLCSLVFVLIMVSNAAFAYQSIKAKITVIQTWSGHDGPLIRLGDHSKSAGFCTRNDWYILPKTHQFYDENFSMLLAAKLADTPVTIKVDSGACVQNMPQIIHLDL